MKQPEVKMKYVKSIMKYKLCGHLDLQVVALKEAYSNTSCISDD